jgi:threonine aldolase
MKLFLRTIAAITVLGSLAAVEISAEGRAAGDLANAREIALADALREAVRQGTGLDVMGSTETKNFTLDFDRVLGSAFGHVKSFKVQESRLGQDGIYRVRVSLSWRICPTEIAQQVGEIFF